MQRMRTRICPAAWSRATHGAACVVEKRSQVGKQVAHAVTEDWRVVATRTVEVEWAVGGIM